MDDYFEQLRRPLRVLDHIKAAGIAYKLCDWSLPPSTQLPSSDHDWSTINFDDLEVGSLITVRIFRKGELLSPLLRSYADIGVTAVVGKVLKLDTHSETLLVLIKDHFFANCFTLWVP